MNLRRLAVLLAGMGVPLPAMVRALIPKPAPIVPRPRLYAAFYPGLSGNAHQRRIERRARGPA